MKYRILGDDIQLVEILLEPGEMVQLETGAMTFMDTDVHMKTTTGGLLKGLKRMLAGESLFITRFHNPTQRPLSVAFASAFPNHPPGPEPGGWGVPGPAHVLPGGHLPGGHQHRLHPPLGDRTLRWGWVHSAAVRGDRLGVLERGRRHRREGPGPGRGAQGVDTGCIVGFAPTVDYDIQFVKGFKNILFGGEGLFLGVVRGPGRVYLQSLPLSRLARTASSPPRVVRWERRVELRGWGTGSSRGC